MPVAIVNPRQTADSPRRLAIGRADAIDARVIADFAEAIRPPARPMPDPVIDELRELLARRRQLVVMINAEKQRLAKAESAVTSARTKMCEAWKPSPTASAAPSASWSSRARCGARSSIC